MWLGLIHYILCKLQLKNLLEWVIIIIIAWFCFSLTKNYHNNFVYSNSRHLDFRWLDHKLHKKILWVLILAKNVFLVRSKLYWCSLLLIYSPFLIIDLYIVTSFEIKLLLFLETIALCVFEKDDVTNLVLPNRININLDYCCFSNAAHFRSAFLCILYLSSSTWGFFFKSSWSILA